MNFKIANCFFEYSMPRRQIPEETALWSLCGLYINVYLSMCVFIFCQNVQPTCNTKHCVLRNWQKNIYTHTYFM